MDERAGKKEEGPCISRVLSDPDAVTARRAMLTWNYAAVCVRGGPRIRREASERGNGRSTLARRFPCSPRQAGSDWPPLRMQNRTCCIASQHVLFPNPPPFLPALLQHMPSPHISLRRPCQMRPPQRARRLTPGPASLRQTLALIMTRARKKLRVADREGKWVPGPRYAEDEWVGDWEHVASQWSQSSKVVCI